MKKLVKLIILFSVSLTSASQLITPIPQNDTYHKQKALLGKKLFSDVRLSKDNTISCASCHQLDLGGDDNLPVAIGIDGKMGTRNTPTVFNARYNFTQFWDGRVADLHSQVEGPIHNPIEMGTNFEEVITKLSKDQNYQQQFKILYNDGITSHNISDAIVEFEKALFTPNSRFDKYLLGDTTALSLKEQEGFKTFKDYGCIGCHNGVNLGSNLFQKVGLLKEYKIGESDLGRFEVTKNKKDTYVFKVPTLRNIELTAPYFHDGKVETLHDAVRYMINYQIGASLNKKDIESIVLFLKTLTGETPKILQGNIHNAKSDS